MRPAGLSARHAPSTRPGSATARQLRCGTARCQSVVAGAVVFAGAVGLTTDHVEALVELHVDLGAVVERDLYLAQLLSSSPTSVSATLPPPV